MSTWETRLVAVSLAGALALQQFIRYEVTGASMAPLLAPGDRLLVRRTRRVWPGDVVVFRDPRRLDRLLVKRVAGVDGGLVTVLGDAADDSTDSRTFGPVPAKLLVGRACYRYFPTDRAGRPGAHSGRRSRRPGPGRGLRGGSTGPGAVPRRPVPR